MKQCFCGCGRTIRRFPVGLRSMNKRGQLVSERLAWAEAVLDAEQNTPDWVQDGRAIVADLRDVMHGELDPRLLEEAPIRLWQSQGWEMEINAKAAGQPVVNEWLPSHGDHVRQVAATTTPDDSSGDFSGQSSESVEALLDTLATISVTDLSADVEQALQAGALQLAANSDVPGDHRATAVSFARLGYFLRALEEERFGMSDAPTTSVVLTFLAELADDRDMEVAVVLASLKLAAEQAPSELAVADAAIGFGHDFRDRVATAWIHQMFGGSFPSGMTADDYRVIFRFGYVVALAVAALRDADAWSRERGRD